MEKRQSQIVRIKNLEKTVTQLYLMIQAILDKLPKDEKDSKSRLTQLRTLKKSSNTKDAVDLLKGYL